ncbi:MAG: hypothetical protein AAGD38_18695 [Acidobacteriota bacterium]
MSTDNLADGKLDLAAAGMDRLDADIDEGFDPQLTEDGQQVINLGDLSILLPNEVSIAEWSLEKVRWQNPRIRAFLGCIRLLSGVLESNYAILHCSPDRLREIWRRVRHVGTLIRRELRPLLSVPSVIPQLEAARLTASGALELLDENVLQELDGFSETVAEEHLIDVRKLLCVSIGQLHSFLQDTFGEVMAADPRSIHDADYFLSKRFPQDIDEAEWLHGTVQRLGDYLATLERERMHDLAPLINRMKRAQRVPEGRPWQEATAFLHKLLGGLTPKLRELLALRGIRFYEMEILDRYTTEIPTKCRLVIEMHDAAREAIDRMQATAGESRTERDQSVRHLTHCHAVFSRRMATELGIIDEYLRDLITFVPVWLEGIEKRRALLLRRGGEESADHPEPTGEDPTTVEIAPPPEST